MSENKYDNTQIMKEYNSHKSFQKKIKLRLFPIKIRMP